MRHIGYVLKRFPRISETFVAAELIELERQGEHVTVSAGRRVTAAVSTAASVVRVALCGPRQ